MDQSVIDAILSEEIVAYRSILGRALKGATTALLLSQLLYMRRYFGGDDGWFYVTQERLQYKTGLTRYEQSTARRNLKDAGVMTEKRAGVPCRLWYKLNDKAIADLVVEQARIDKELQSSLLETHKLDSGKSTNKTKGLSRTINSNKKEEIKSKKNPPTITTEETVSDIAESNLVGDPLADIASANAAMGIKQDNIRGRHRTVKEIRESVAKAILGGAEPENESPAAIRKGVKNWLLGGYGELFCNLNGSSQPDSVINGWVGTGVEIVKAAKFHTKTWAEAYSLVEEATMALFTCEDEILNPMAWLVKNKDKAVTFTGLSGARVRLIDMIGHIAENRAKFSQSVAKRERPPKKSRAEELANTTFGHRVAKREGILDEVLRIEKEEATADGKRIKL